MAQSLLVLVLPFAFLALEKIKPAKMLASLNLRLKNPVGQLLRGVWLFLAVMALLFAQAIIFALLGLSDTSKVEAVLSKQTTLGLLAVLLIAPIGEELLFRGYLLRKIGLVASSVLFAALHWGFGSVQELAAALTAALLFGWYVQKNKLLLPAMVAHALVNAYSVVVVFFVK